MNALGRLHNQKGSTLIEAMIAIAILTIGILTVMVMQVNAIRASSSAINRTEANNISIALLETLKRLPFDNTNLSQPANNPTFTELNTASTAQNITDLITGAKVKTFTNAVFPEMASLIQAGATAGTVVDHAGITYQLAWAVQDQILATGETLNKTIWVFMTWNTLMGQNRLKMTSMKYNNISL